MELNQHKWNLLNKTKNEQNRTRDLEIKNKQTVTREGRWITGDRRGMDKPRNTIEASWSWLWESGGGWDRGKQWVKRWDNCN